MVALWVVALSAVVAIWMLRPPTSLAVGDPVIVHRMYSRGSRLTAVRTPTALACAETVGEGEHETENGEPAGIEAAQVTPRAVFAVETFVQSNVVVRGVPAATAMSELCGVTASETLAFAEDVLNSVCTSHPSDGVSPATQEAGAWAIAMTSFSEFAATTVDRKVRSVDTAAADATVKRMRAVPVDPYPGAGRPQRTTVPSRVASLWQADASVPALSKMTLVGTKTDHITSGDDCDADSFWYVDTRSKLAPGTAVSVDELKICE